MSRKCGVDALIGLTLSKVIVQGMDEIYFHARTGEVFRMYHEQDCCESVEIESIVGVLDDLIGSPILKAEEVISDTLPRGMKMPVLSDDGCLWTFYKLATFKGYVDIRWFGTSNGYYSESVDFVQVTAA